LAARDKVWQVVLYGAAAVTLVLGIVEAIREQQLTGALDPGTPPPAFTAVQRDGAAFSLSQERGKAVVLSFWATWCPPCLREMPQLRKLEAELGAQGMALVAASMDNPDVREEAVADWLKKQGGPPPLIVFPTDETARAWHAGSLPTLYVLGRDGSIVASHSGLTPEVTLRREIGKALQTGQ
jgi:thiol-disulfide isomerase/thioredoxin